MQLLCRYSLALLWNENCTSLNALEGGVGEPLNSLRYPFGSINSKDKQTLENEETDESRAKKKAGEAGKNDEKVYSCEEEMDIGAK